MASVEIKDPLSETTIYTIYSKTEATVVRRHDRRFWSIYAKEVKSLYGYACLEYEAKDQEREGTYERLAINRRVFKTEYG